MLGYFKSRRMFFNYKLEDASTDIAYILANYFPEYSVTRIKISGKTTRIQQQKLICRYLNYQRYDSVMAAKLSELAARVVKRSAKPVYILRELLGYLNRGNLNQELQIILNDYFGHSGHSDSKNDPLVLPAISHPSLEPLRHLSSRQIE